MGKKVKTLESGGYTPAFSRLWAFGGGFMVGGESDLGVDICNLRS